MAIMGYQTGISQNSHYGEHVIINIIHDWDALGMNSWATAVGIEQMVDLY